MFFFYQINDLFDSRRFNNASIFKQLASKFKKKDQNQIKLKYESLRRQYTDEKALEKKSGACPKPVQIYEEQMEMLWGKRKKLTTPISCGMDSTASDFRGIKIKHDSLYDKEEETTTSCPKSSKTVPFDKLENGKLAQILIMIFIYNL